MSAQNIYIMDYPDAGISFWGLIIYGVALSLGQLVTTLFRFNEHFGYDRRLQWSYALYGVACVVLLLRTDAYIVYASYVVFAILGQTVQSPLYAVAALAAEGDELLSALQVGLGLASVVNIAVYIVIRLIILWLEVGTDGNIEAAINTADRLSMKVFLLLAIFFVCHVFLSSIISRTVCLHTGHGLRQQRRFEFTRGLVLLLLAVRKSYHVCGRIFLVYFSCKLYVTL